MALLKIVQTPYGYEANYHKIIMMALDIGAKALSIQTVVFKDKDARDTNKAPMGSINTVLQNETWDESYKDGITVSQAYDVLKNQPVFTDAENA